MIDSITNNHAVSSFAAQKNEQVHIAHSERELVNQRKEAVYYNQKIYLTTSSLETLTVFAGFVSVFMYQFSQGQATVGDFMFVMTGLSGMMNAIKTLSDRSFWLYEQIGIGQDAIRKIIVPHSIKDVPDARELNISKAEIVFDNVAFAYFDGKPVLHNITKTIRSGEKVGLIGYSGEGKTTLVNLLLRFFELTGGRILIDGQDITQVTQHSLRRSIALIPQDTSLFHRTLRENIRIANPTATEEQVIAASRMAEAHDFIMTLPLQYDTMGERGIKLSGGQRQRVAIARAFLKDAPILMLDEATSALDSMTERQIQNALDKVMQGRTTLVIAHRLSTLSRMDRILVFDKGQIIEQGNHEELLAQNGHYAQMWAMQAGGFMPETEEPSIQ